MQPSAWGKYIWTTMHLVALGMPEAPTAKELRDYALFYERLHTVLPCAKCAEHYQEHLKAHPVPTSGGRDAFFAWTVKLHNVVNAQLGRAPWTLERARAHYERLGRVGSKGGGAVTGSRLNIL
jgi:mitochondrial FAD-linked sulfhydryl oxidase